MSGRELKSERLPQHLDECVRLIDQHNVGIRQEFAKAIVAEREIGDQQMVIDDHYLGIQRLAARLGGKTAFELRTASAEAVFYRGGHHRPHRRMFR